MAGRTKKIEGPIKATSVRLEEEIVLELAVWAKLKGKSLGEAMGDQVREWWESNPERESIRALVQNQTAEKPQKKTAKKKTSKAA